MLDLQQVTRLADDIARAALAGRLVESVVVEPSVDWLGNDALRITVLVQDDGAGRPFAEAIIAVENTLRDQLHQLGDDRFPIVDVLTPEDLAADVGP